MRKLMREKHLKNITVDEICVLADIGRRTFYRYYLDKYALFEDTYIQEFYSKLGIEDGAYLYDIYGAIVAQMYDEQDFFKHAIAVKEQNGFWDLMSDLIFPRVVSQLSSDPKINKMRDYYVRKDIETALYMIEQWILEGYKESPEQIAKDIRHSSAAHGKWKYQLATKNEPDEYSLEKLENYEW